MIEGPAPETVAGLSFERSITVSLQPESKRRVWEAAFSASIAAQYHNAVPLDGQSKEETISTDVAAYVADIAAIRLEAWVNSGYCDIQPSAEQLVIMFGGKS